MEIAFFLIVWSICFSQYTTRCAVVPTFYWTHRWSNRSTWLRVMAWMRMCIRERGETLFCSHIELHYAMFTDSWPICTLSPCSIWIVDLVSSGIYNRLLIHLHQTAISYQLPWEIHGRVVMYSSERVGFFTIKATGHVKLTDLDWTNQKLCDFYLKLKKQSKRAANYLRSNVAWANLILFVREQKLTARGWAQQATVVS